MHDWLFMVPGIDPRQGGIQVSALDLLPALDPRRTKYVVFGSDPQRICDGSFRATCDSSKFKLLAKVACHTWPADVAVCWHMGMLKLLPFTRGFRGKVVVFLHGVEAWREHSPSLLRELQGVDLFLSNSDYTWQRFLEFAPALKNHPHITTALGFGTPTPCEPKPPQPTALMVGRMMLAEDYKGHRELISAWPCVLDKCPAARLEIIGEGDLKPVLENLVQSLSLQQHVTFHGRVDEETKQRLLKACRVMALPSRCEGFGIVYLEAMRYGRPCLVSHCDAGREVVNPPEAGLAVDPGNASQLVESMLQLLDGPQWQTWSAQAHARYNRHYTVQAYQQRILAAVESLF